MTTPNSMLDLFEVLRGVLDALDAAIDSDVRRTGSIEAQKAATLARRARVKLDAVGMAALREVG